MIPSDYNENAIAVVGLAGRFPGAPDIDSLWNNLSNGVESTTFFDDDTLLAAGIDAATLARPDFVKAKPFLPDIDQFDAHYFGIHAAEAEQMDPQHRIFLECCVTALEHGCIAPDHFDGYVGIFGGSGISTYWSQVNQAANNNALWSATAQAAIGNIQDYLCSRVAYKLNLKGPCYTVQTACSTSLVAVHLACQHLQNFECDVALAGGVSITVPEVSGYFYQENSIVSPDGHCRPYDAHAAGTLFGSGVGVVALKRLEDAITDRNPIHAVILGSAINNDGSLKAAYTAPSTSGQSRAITEALANADISPETIRYVEGHGTATPIGDPIEVAALTQAYRLHTEKKQYCALGSIKSNMGHLDTAAGIAGFIKTVLSLKHKTIAPTLHFQSPNPKIDFANSPFYVAAQTEPWPESDIPRRAAVSSFGVGGSNAHVILQEAPPPPASGPSREKQVLVLSAKSEEALHALKQDVADYLDADPETPCADVLATLSQARSNHPHRFAAVCSTEHADNAIDILDEEPGTDTLSGQAYSVTPRVTFLFPGQGSQYINMASELYQKQPTFKKHLDQCAEYIRPYVEVDLRSVIFADAPDNFHSERLQDTQWTQPALFAIEYSLARLLMDWGIQPQALIGHSIGEYVAACIAGIFSLSDALMLVTRRGQLISSLPSGSMLAISSDAETIKTKLNSELSLAVVNSPQACVVAGTHEAIDAFQQKIESEGLRSRRLHTSHAFHSHMMEAILPEFRAHFDAVTLNPPTIPYLSNLTGTWIQAAEATDPEYWLRHLRRTVLFSDGIQEILKESEQCCIEVGPGHTLSTLSRQQGKADSLPTLISLLPDAREKKCSYHSVLRGIAQAWVAGVDVHWKTHYEGETRNQLALPTYPFQRKRYWIEGDASAQNMSPSLEAGKKQKDISQWFYLPSWKQAPLIESPDSTPRSVLLIASSSEVTSAFADSGHSVRALAASNDRGTWTQALQALQSEPFTFDSIVYFAQGDDLASLTALTQVLAQVGITHDLKLCIVQQNRYSVIGNESLNPDCALNQGPCKVIPQEYPHISCKSIDVDAGTSPATILREVLSDNSTTEVALRYGQRWALDYPSIEVSEKQPELTPQGVYWIIGGLGGVGLSLAKALSQIEPNIHIVLSNRKELSEANTQAIETIQTLRDQGTQVTVLPVDINDWQSLDETVSKLRETAGPIQGIIHAAGIPGGKIIERQDTASMNTVLAPKVDGTRNLIEATQDEPPTFIMLCSSLASLTGGIGQIDYVSANAFQDGIAHTRRNANTTRIVSINWDAWLDTGMTQSGKQSTQRDALAITPEEGIEVFKRILTLKEPQIIVSTSPLASRLITQTIDQETPTSSNNTTKHPRPALNVDFVAPSNDTERYWVQTWETLLSIEGIGIHDNFFELGGDSFTALQLTAQVKEEKGWSLSVTQLYQAPTIATLSQQNI